MRQAYVDHDRRFLLFWTPKCACSSLVHWFARGVIGATDAALASTAGDPRIWLSRNGYAIHDRRAAELVRDGYYSVAFTRHPFKRAVSAYASKFVSRWETMVVTFDDLEPFARVAYLAITGQSAEEGRSSYRGVSFVEYLDFVLGRVATRNGEPSLNRHWNTQVPFLYQADGIMPTRCFDISQLADGINEISRHFGYRPVLHHDNRTAYTAGCGEIHDATRSLDLAIAGIVPGPANLLTRRTARMVNDAYAIDFAMLGYPNVQRGCLVALSSIAKRFPRLG